MTTVTDRLYSQNTRAVIRAARAGPVFITSRGQPTHVLMTHKEYERLAERSAKSRSRGEALASDGDPDIDLELPQRAVEPERSNDF